MLQRIALCIDTGAFSAHSWRSRYQAFQQGVGILSTEMVALTAHRLQMSFKNVAMSVTKRSTKIPTRHELLTSTRNAQLLSAHQTDSHVPQVHNQKIMRAAGNAFYALFVDHGYLEVIQSSSHVIDQWMDENLLDSNFRDVYFRIGRVFSSMLTPSKTINSLEAKLRLCKQKHPDIFYRLFLGRVVTPVFQIGLGLMIMADIRLQLMNQRIDLTGDILKLIFAVGVSHKMDKIFVDTLSRCLNGEVINVRYPDEPPYIDPNYYHPILITGIAITGGVLIWGSVASYRRR